MGIKTVSLTSKSQRAIEKDVSEYLQDWVAGGLPRYPGALTPDIPPDLMSSFNEFASQYGQYDPAISGAMTDALAGKPAIDFDPTEATKLFEEKFYTPMMAMFKDIAVPAIRESMNVPGAAFSSGLGITPA